MALRDLALPSLILTAAVAVVGLAMPPGAAVAAPIDIKPPTKFEGIYDSTAQVKQKGNTSLPECKGAEQKSPNLDGRESYAKWSIESSIGNNSVVPVGAEWNITMVIDAHSPDSKGDNGPYYTRVSWRPKGPIQKVGPVVQSYNGKYNFGKTWTGLYDHSGKVADDPFSITFRANSRPGILKTSDGAYMTATFKVRATAPGIISAERLFVSGADDTGVPVITVDNTSTQFACDMIATFQWVVVAPTPTVLPESASVDARYTNTVTGDAMTGPHRVLVVVLANDSDPNFPLEVGSTDRLRVSDWTATSVQGGTVSCGTPAQKAPPLSTPSASLSPGPCSYTPPVGFSGLDSFTYKVRSAYTNGEATGTVTVNVRANNRPASLDVVYGTATGEDKVFDLAPIVGDVDGDPVTCFGNGAAAPAVGVATVAANCSLTWDNQDAGFTGNVAVPYRVCDTRTTLTGGALGVNVTRAADYASGDLSETTARRCSAATLTITILPGLKLPPTGVADVDFVDGWHSEHGHVATSLSIPVLANDVDGNGPNPTMPTAALAVLTGPTPAESGTAQVVGDRIVFTPADGYWGPVGLTYRVCEDPAVQAPPYVDDPDTPLIDEGLPVCGVGQVIIGVIYNSPPQTTNDEIQITPLQTIVGFPVAANDIDPEGGTLTCVPAALELLTPAKIQSASITTNCLLNLDPIDSATGNVQVRYLVCDDRVLGNPTWETNPYAADGRGPGDPWTKCSTAIVNVDLLWDLDQIVLPGENNQPPVCQADQATTPFNTPVTIPVLANDTDDSGELILPGPGEDTPGFSAQGGTFYADLDVDDNQATIVFTPNAGFVGSDTFTYVAMDPDAATCQATVTVLVQPGPPPELPPTGRSLNLALGALALLLVGALLTLSTRARRSAAAR